jgi:DNA-binding response OmpR family regulator
MVEPEMMKAVITVRLLTQAPLIVLTDNHTLDWSIRALHSGADALFTINMPDDVIVARSKALLRRWMRL